MCIEKGEQHSYMTFSPLIWTRRSDMPCNEGRCVYARASGTRALNEWCTVIPFMQQPSPPSHNDVERMSKQLYPRPDTCIVRLWALIVAKTDVMHSKEIHRCVGIRVNPFNIKLCYRPSWLARRDEEACVSTHGCFCTTIDTDITN